MRFRVAPLVGLLIAVLGFVPLVNWLPSDLHDAQYLLQLRQWAAGTIVVAGIGVALAICTPHVKWLWLRAGRPSGADLDTWLDERHVVFALAVTALAAIVYGVVALALFRGGAVLIDEMVQIKQARIFAAGHLWLPTPQHPEFFSSLNMVDQSGRVYSQFPPGGPAFLALGERVGSSWWVNPVAGALCVLAWAAFLRKAEPSPRTSALALVLFAFAPFTVFMSGSHMNHVTTLMCLTVAMAGLAEVTTSSVPRPTLAAISGIGFGAAATIRPVDALAFALPAAVWYLWRAVRERSRWADAVAALAGVALPMSAMMWVNVHTTGAPLRFGYEVLWGPGHDIGFHLSPLGVVHTPARGLAITNLYFLQLQDFLFESPLPSLIPAIAAFLLTQRLRPLDRYLLTSSALLIGLYLAYWHNGYFLGPRFMYPLAPILTMWTARLPALARARLGGGFAWRATAYTLIASAAIGETAGVAQRGSLYASTLSLDQVARPHGPGDDAVRDALVFVRESWESQLVVRLWALGVSHTDAEALYHDVDACRLEEAVGDLERNRDRGSPSPDVMAALRPLMRDSLAVRPVKLHSGVTVRIEPATLYVPRCLARLRETEAGVVPLTPYTLLQGDRNVYARDLNDRDTVLLAAYPHRPVYLLRPETNDPTALPHFYPVSLDSARRAWASTASTAKRGERLIRPRAKPG
jgi:hypothetical protein